MMTWAALPPAQTHCLANKPITLWGSSLLLGVTGQTAGAHTHTHTLSQITWIKSALKSVSRDLPSISSSVLPTDPWAGGKEQHNPDSFCMFYICRSHAYLHLSICLPTGSGTEILQGRKLAMKDIIVLTTSLMVLLLKRVFRTKPAAA